MKNRFPPVGHGCCAVLSACAALAGLVSGQDRPRLGELRFPTSASLPAAQSAFLDGVLLLHSFEYEDAREAFRRAGTIEPGFAMATWGEALTHYHPIWRQEAPEKAQEALARLAADPVARAALAPTDIEKAWLDSVEQLFGRGTRSERWTAYRDALAAMHDRHPYDVEIAAMYALSTIATSFGRREPRIYMRAAAIAQPFWQRHPDHPGLLHYLIHCFDEPVHAPLGLPMAQRYDKVAPDAGHALHMPSHIYLALGRWQESIDANVASFAAGDARRARKGLGVEARYWHACQWLAYSHLQRGQSRAAAALLAAIHRDHGENPARTLRYHLIVMRATHLVETGDGTAPAAAWQIDCAQLPGAVVAAEYHARGMAALARGDSAAARASWTAVRATIPKGFAVEAAARAGDPAATAACCAPSGQRPDSIEDHLAATVVAHQLEAALALAAGEPDIALRHSRQACAAEDRMDLDYGPPAVARPAHEALGELLLERGRPVEARQEFAAALVRAPGRGRSLLGLARAQHASGETAAAQRTYRQLAEQWRVADPGWPGLAEVRAVGGIAVDPAPERAPDAGR